jgi:hypothetical protein
MPIEMIEEETLTSAHRSKLPASVAYEWRNAVSLADWPYA